jgi:MoxR-like ATPase
MTDAATRAREIVEIANSGDDCDCRWSGDPHVLRDFCAVHTRQRDAIVQALTALDAAEARVAETPETVERVAEALWRDHFPHLSPDWTWAEKCEALPESVERYRSFARVVLRAVREAP